MEYKIFVTISILFLSPHVLSLCVWVFQLRLTVAEAVCSMCHLMASDKLEEQIPKLIPAILSLYKKNNEHYIISKVCMGFSISEVDCYMFCSMDYVLRNGTPSLSPPQNLVGINLLFL